MIDTDSIEAARLVAAGSIRVDREFAQQAGPGDVLVRVTAVGLCGSDLHWYREAGIGDATLARPLVLGHEFVGVILEGPRAGERVVADPADPCGRCQACLGGRANVCLAARFAGFGTTDGALRTVMPWPKRLLHRLPDAMGDDEATLLEPLGVALHALDLGQIGVGGRAGVYGCGPLGLLIVALLRITGAAVIVATDREPHRVEMARMMGATHGFVVGDADADAAAMPVDRRHARDERVDVAFEVSGDDDALSDAMAATRPGGRVVLVGIPTGDRSSFEAATARRKELTLQLCRRMLAADLPRAIALGQARRIALSSLITHRYPLDEVTDAFATLASRHGLKVVVNPTPAVPAGASR